MGQIPTIRDDIKALRGVHLYHFAVSNCSQRVRMALEEKGVAWVSHHIDLARNEHLKSDFLAINPKHLVPVLVHDGCTITESNDIITYVDRRFPGPALMPAGGADRAFVESALLASGGIQSAIKLVSHEFLFKPVRRMNARQLAKFEKSCANPQLLQFMRDWSSEGGFGRNRIRAALAEFEPVHAMLEGRLRGHSWLSGAQCGLADISWTVNVHRLKAMRFPFDRYVRLSDWYERIRRRASFSNALTRYESGAVNASFAVYSWVRRLQGTAVSDYL